MKRDNRRHIASWLLLAVFVPMLLFSSLHVHEERGFDQMSCAECVAHHCQGHLAQADISFDACVLCQFLSLAFVSATFAAIDVVFNVLWICYAPLSSKANNACRGAAITRGPPFA